MPKDEPTAKGRGASRRIGRHHFPVTGMNVRSQSRIFGQSAGHGKRFVLLASNFHSSITEKLIQGAKAVLLRHGVLPSHIHVVLVSGSFELPFVAARLLRRQPKPHAIITLGALIRGQTLQYEIIAQAVAYGLIQVSLRYGIPITFGVIVAEKLAEAKERAGGRMGNRGAEAARAALLLLQK